MSDSYWTEFQAEKEAEKKHLDSLKAGDVIECIEHDRFGGQGYFRKITVIKRTATQIVCSLLGLEIRFNARTGRRIGRGYWPYELPMPADPKEVAKARNEHVRRALANEISETKFKNLPIGVLREIAATLETHKREKELAENEGAK